MLMISLSQLKWGVVAVVLLLVLSMVVPGALIVLPVVGLGGAVQLWLWCCGSCSPW